MFKFVKFGGAVVQWSNTEQDVPSANGSYSVWS